MTNPALTPPSSSPEAPAPVVQPVVAPSSKTTSPTNERELVAKSWWQRSASQAFIAYVVLALAGWDFELTFLEWLDLHRVTLAGMLLAALGINAASQSYRPVKLPRGKTAP